MKYVLLVSTPNSIFQLYEGSYKNCDIRLNALSKQMSSSKPAKFLEVSRTKPHKCKSNIRTNHIVHISIMPSTLFEQEQAYDTAEDEDEEESEEDETKPKHAKNTQPTPVQVKNYLTIIRETFKKKEDSTQRKSTE